MCDLHWEHNENDPGASPVRSFRNMRVECQETQHAGLCKLDNYLVEQNLDFSKGGGAFKLFGGEGAGAYIIRENRTG